MDKKWLILFSTGIMIVLVNLDTSIVNLALATIAKTMDISLPQMQWIINIYLLCAAILFVIGGRLAQIYGKRRIFLIGVSFFFLGSLIAGCSNAYPLLVAGRLLQGVGFAFTLGLSLVMTLESFPLNQRGLAVGISVTLSGAAQAIGPTVGGIILQFFSWHWIFLLNLPFCLLSFFLTRGAYAADQPTHSQEKIDLAGILILSLGLGLTLTAINNLHLWSLTSFILCLICGATSLIIFYFFEKKQAHPLINFQLFCYRDYNLSSILRVIFMYGWSMLLFVLPLFLQNIRHYNPVITGLWMLCMSIMLGIVSPITGVFLDRIGFEKPMLLSMLCSAICFMLLCFVDASHAFWLLAIALFLYGIATGLNIPSTFSGAVASVEKSMGSLAVGVFFTLTFLSSSFGVALNGAQLNWLSYQKLQEQLSNAHFTFSEKQADYLNQFSNGTQNIENFKHAFPAEQFTQASQLANTSFVHGFHSLMIINFVLSLIGVGIYFRFKKR